MKEIVFSVTICL